MQKNENITCAMVDSEVKFMTLVITFFFKSKKSEDNSCGQLGGGAANTLWVW
jgi:hypothetical protein